MAFFFNQIREQGIKPKSKKTIPIATMNSMGCKACPHDKAQLEHPKMQACGDNNPDVYVLGDSPSEADDSKGEPFAGKSGRFLKARIPKSIKSVRYNNTIRCNTKKEGTPDVSELECFPAGTLVQPLGKINKLYSRWYEGALVTVKTRSGRTLSGTQNHPIFTSKGKSAFKDIKVGDYLLSTTYKDVGIISGNPHRNYEPTPIDEIFNSFLKVTEVERMSTTSFNFHGDGIPNGQVNIIRASSELFGNSNIRINKFGTKQFQKLKFSITNTTKSLLMFFSSLKHTFFILTMVVAFLSFIRGMRFIPSKNAALCISNFNSSSLKSFYNIGNINIFRKSNRFSRFFILVSNYNVCFRFPFTPTILTPSKSSSKTLGFCKASKKNTIFNQEFFDSLRISPSNGMNSIETIATEVELDDVISIEICADFRGHVYNLETGSHKYIANGIVVSNCCRNYIVEDIEKSKPLIVVGAGNGPLTWATGLSNVTHWRGKPVATQIGKHACWYYPIMHPSYVLGRQKDYGKSEYELAFEHDWEEIGKLVKTATTPVIYTGDYDKGIERITGNAGRADLNRLEDALNRLVCAPQVGLDIETNSFLRPFPTGAKIITCAVGTFEDTVAFALDHPEGWSGDLRKEAWGLFIDFLMESNKKIAHSLGFELEWLCYNIDKKLAYKTEWADTLLMSHTLDERKGVQSLDDLTRQHFGFFLKEQSPVDTKRMMDFPLDEVLRYNGMDSKWTELLERTLHPMIYNNKKYKFEYERKLRLAPALVLTQLKGVAVDFEYANKIKTELETSLMKAEKGIRACAEVKKYESQFGSFSPTSPDHVLKLLKDVCHREEVFVGGSKASADEEVLNSIPAGEVPAAPLILEHRIVSKLLSTYVLPVTERKCVSPDGLIHTKYSSTVAETGRAASEDPNLQNYPKRKHKEIRGMIVASTTGRNWLFPADYAQLEARVFAWASEDENLVRYMWEGYDIHGYWRDRVLKEYPRVQDRIITDYAIDKHGDVDKQVKKMLRDEIKNGWVFPQFFGASFKSCAGNLKIPVDTAQELAEEFWGEFKGVKKWQEKLLKGYERNCYVETMDGRRRRGVLSKNQVINHPIQGTAADLVLAAMSELTEYAMFTEQDRFQPVLNVHDDLVTNGEDTDEETMFADIDTIVRIMCKHRYKYINCPVVVEVGMGKNWHTSKEIGVYSSADLFNLVNPYGTTQNN